MKKPFFKKQTFYFNLLISQLLIHIVYKLTYIDFIENHLEISKNLFDRNFEKNQFYIESPFFILLSNILKITNIDIFLIFIYIITQIFLFLILINIDFLGNYSTIFLFSGWLVTVSWFMGYVDIISVFLIVIISKQILQDNEQIDFKILIYFALLSINHYGIAIFVFVNILLLSSKKRNKELFKYSLIGLTIGYFLINLYLNFISFSGRSRIRFIFNDGILKNSIDFVSNNLLELFWSGLLGTIFILLYFVFTSERQQIIKYLSVVIVSLFATSLGLDTSRIFSIIILPLVIKMIIDFKNKRISNTTFERTLILLIVGVTFLFQEQYIYGKVNLISPNQISPNFYDLITRIVNSLLSNIWV
tara:strand:- start:2952 stop:4034 length:1083 start_codon:yes stop_codon:yes gene_type:complete